MTTDVAEKVMEALGGERSEPQPKVKKAHVKQAEGAQLKKSGAATWKPAQRLETVKRVKGFSYRWCSNDSANLQRKQAEGWQFVNESTGIPGEHVRPDAVADGSALTGLNSYRELVLMALPQDLADARKAYHRELTDRQTEGVKDRLRTDLDRTAAAGRGDRTAIHGSVTID